MRTTNGTKCGNWRGFKKPPYLSTYIYMWEFMDRTVNCAKRGNKAALDEWKRGSVPHVNLGTGKRPAFAPAFTDITERNGKSVYRAVRYGEIHKRPDRFVDALNEDMKCYWRLYSLFAKVVSMDDANPAKRRRAKAK